MGRLLRCATVAGFVLLGTGCGIELTGISPDVIPQGAASTLAITGSGFSEDTTFSLVAPGLSVALRTLSVDTGAAEVEAPATTPAGLYTLSADNAGTVAELPDALTVLADAARVRFLDIGQGDATLLLAPDGERALIDGGKPSRTDVVRAAVEDAGGTLTMVILSHYDADHLGGVVGLLKGPDGTAGTDDDIVPAERYAPSDDGACQSQLCDEFRALRAYPFTVPAPGDTLALGRLSLVVEAVGGRTGAAPAPAGLDDNAVSLVVRATFADRSVLILGDLTGGGLGTVDIESAVAERTGAVDVLRAGHHGSATSSNAAAVSAWSPRLTVLSVGTDNAYCHPAPQVLARLAANSTELLATGAGMVTDGACDFLTNAPDNGSLGLGTIELSIDAAGAMSLDGQPL